MALINLMELTKNSIIITPNERLSRRLRLLFGEQMNAQKVTVWPAPPIYSLLSWYHQLYQAAIEYQLLDEIVLSPLQYIEIWQQVISNFLNDKKFIEPHRTVAEMIKALQTLKQWRVSYYDAAFNYSEESQFFVQCVTHIEKILRNNNWISSDEVPERLNSISLKGILNNIEKIILFGFDDITPQTQYFLANLSHSGIQVEKLDWALEATSIKLHSFLTAEQEYFAMAQWAKNQVAAGYQKIACIVPDLTSARELIIRAFNQVFQPNLLFEYYTSSQHFNISGGEPLSSLPMIKEIFNFLMLFNDEIDYNILSNIILSPFIAFAETERFPRIELEGKLREKSLKTIYHQYLPEYLLSELCPHFYVLWQTVLSKKNLPKHALPSKWIAWLSELLRTWGWPGERTLNSREFQQLEQWYAVLDEITTLDDHAGNITFSAFVHLLKQVSHAVNFQIKTAETPVQVLGMLEASGNLYDCVWVAGLTDKTWPPAVQLNPYIPFELQRRCNMPHASSQRQYDYSQQMMNRWLHSSPILHFSYAESDGNEPLVCSALLKPYQQFLEPIPSPEWQLSQYLQHTRDIATVTESTFLPFTPMPEKTFASSLFEQQVNCPFQAFAKQRLNCKEFATPPQSWDPRLRGTMIHAVMEKLWLQWQDSNILQQLSESEIQQQLEKIITEVLLKTFKGKQHDFFQLEKERLLTIISKWLLIEKQRPPFTIHAIESQHSAHFAGLELNLKIDRIDKATTGEWILIDYKANIQNINDWFTSPPNKPQMLIYANVLMPEPDIITYASLHPSDEKMRFFGLARHETDFPNVKPFNSNKHNVASTWDELLQIWRMQLIHIAQDFIAGNVTVKPRTPDTCNYCHLTSLCRINDK